MALQTSLRVIDLDELTRARLVWDGFDRKVVDEYIPFIDFEALDSDPEKLPENIRALSDIAIRHNEEVRRRQDQESYDKS